MKRIVVVCASFIFCSSIFGMEQQVQQQEQEKTGIYVFIKNKSFWFSSKQDHHFTCNVGDDLQSQSHLYLYNQVPYFIPNLKKDDTIPLDSTTQISSQAPESVKSAISAFMNVIKDMVPKNEDCDIWYNVDNGVGISYDLFSYKFGVLTSVTKKQITNEQVTQFKKIAELVKKASQKK